MSIHGPVVLTQEQRVLCEFCGYDKDDLALARLIAAQVCERYGQDTPDELDRIRKGEIWNDHIAVQSALAAIRITKAADARAAGAPFPKPKTEKQRLANLRYAIFDQN